MANIIEIKNLKKFFATNHAVDGISLEIEKGEVFGFLGPNGAGKTTTIRCMMDFLRPTEGEIKILGLDAQKNSEELKNDIAYLPGNVRLYNNWTGQDHIDFFANFSGDKKLASELAKKLDFNPKIKFYYLSSGNKQKLGIILTLMKKPKLIILDEPTNALDPLLQNKVHELLIDAKNAGATIFLSSHNLAEVDKICNRVAIIKAGKIIAVEDIQNLKEKKMHKIIVSFDDNVEEKDLKTKNVDAVEKLNQHFSISVKGDLNPVIDQISKHKIRDLEISHASLEEVFLEFYQK